MNAGEECAGCDPILPRMTSMHGWTDASIMRSWGLSPEGMPRSDTGSVRARLASIGLARLVLFLDFDGTLVPIAARPEHVTLNETVRGGLDRLARLIPIVVVSGRSVGDLRRIIGLGNSII